MPPICFIIFCASAKRLSSWLTSITVTPEPLAMRARREPLMIFGLVRSPGVIDRMIAVTLSKCLSSSSASWSFIWPMPGIMASTLAIGPIRRTAMSWSRKSSRVNCSPPMQLGGHLLLLIGVEGLLGLLDQGEHVAHAEDPAGHPVGVEDVEVLQLLAGGGEQDRLAGDLRGPTARHHRGRRRRAWRAPRR